MQSLYFFWRWTRTWFLSQLLLFMSWEHIDNFVSIFSFPICSRCRRTFHTWPPFTTKLDLILIEATESIYYRYLSCPTHPISMYVVPLPSFTGWSKWIITELLASFGMWSQTWEHFSKTVILFWQNYVKKLCKFSTKMFNFDEVSVI